MQPTSMPLQYKRLYRGPLEADSVFNSLKDAQDYLINGTAYPGQIISVFLESENLWSAYMVGSDNQLHPITTSNSNNSGCTWDVLELT